MKPRFRLGFLLIIYTIVSMLIAGAVFAGVQAGGSYIVNEKLYTRQRVLDREKSLFSEFIDYLNENKVSITSRRDGMKWLDGRGNIMIAVYNGGNAFDNDDSGVMLISVSKDAPAMYELLQNDYADYWYTCPVMMRGDRMRTKVVKVMYYPMYTALRGVTLAAAGIAFAAFVVSLILFIRGKTRYIAYLSKQLTVMEGGELGQSLEIKGSDELTLLADNMERMRLSFIERLKHEEEMDTSTKELMTAMSHDLRTPLTALMGYLEIADRAGGDDKTKQYISAALKRARQLKGMTDELFEYFLVYSAGDESIELESADALEAISAIWEECGFVLESEGYDVDITRGTSCRVKINGHYIHRVLDNIVSNIRKYADASCPVKIKMESAEGGFRVTAENTAAEKASAESSGIGLKSCAKIVSAHGGKFAYELCDKTFHVSIWLPEVG